MQIVILAGGLGTRLSPITETIPKPMIEINGVPFLEYQIKVLKKYGFTKILILAGYLGELIQKHFGDGSHLEVSIAYSFEKGELLGTGGAIKEAERYLDDEFIVINGDTFLDYDYNHLIDTYKKSPHQLMCMFTSRLVNAHNQLQRNLHIEQGLVKMYNKASDNGKEFKHSCCGVYLLKKNTLKELRHGQKASLEYDIMMPWIKKGCVGTYCIDQSFYDIGTFERLEIFKSLIK